LGWKIHEFLNRYIYISSNIIYISSNTIYIYSNPKKYRKVNSYNSDKFLFYPLNRGLGNKAPLSPWGVVQEAQQGGDLHRWDGPQTMHAELDERNCKEAEGNDEAWHTWSLPWETWPEICECFKIMYHYIL
jgi:hypothetical protein